MKKRDFETYQKRLRDFEILPKFSETHVFRGTIRHPYSRTISHPLQKLLCVVNGKKKARRGRWEEELLFPSSTTRSLKPRRSLCGGGSATDSFLGYSNFPASSLS